ncbi:carboxymuconolactone decarboxylase family protein [Jeongeupia naejangsanensis]|uniref:Carboxymuconolactone decarboxylase family protein n=1 Tax=Jeongeupia naejangsanensis TaxID=613195 RepID=A0ABS2BMU2_9NEIS|nr:carboxymuconolactone decarboxylase family protein [Jeongeupia naejangsanensis]MBM3116957.1 carboxymuconolactone decarboxylase family protein [Jeongeupia naejangsanensis]
MNLLDGLGQRALGQLAPKLAALSDEVLFGDVWQRPQLSKRDRSLITVATLLALGRSEQLPFHFNLARAHGVSDDELRELGTHLAFYAGWPAAASALTVLGRPDHAQE